MTWFLPQTDDEQAAQEYERVVADLEMAQNMHKVSKIHCLNADPKPKACGFCKSKFEDEYFVWRLLMIVNG